MEEAVQEAHPPPGHRSELTRYLLPDVLDLRQYFALELSSSLTCLLSRCMTSFGSGSGQSCPQCSQINFMVTSSPGGGRYGYASSCAADYTFSLERQRGQLIFQLRQKLVLRAAELMLKCSAPNSAASSCKIWGYMGLYGGYIGVIFRNHGKKMETTKAYTQGIPVL